MIDIIESDPVASIVRDALAYIDNQGTSETHIALTGGRSGSQITTKLVAACADNPRVHFWFSDERFLPRHDTQRNDYGIDAANMLCHIHCIAASDELQSAQEAAEQYSATIHQVLTSRFCADNSLVDICLLSVGEDGHVASLFPGYASLDEKLGVIGINDSPKPPSARVTWTYPTINASRQVWLIATGKEKSNAVSQLQADADFHDIPAAGVHGKQETRLYIDVEASSPD